MLLPAALLVLGIVARNPAPDAANDAAAPSTTIAAPATVATTLPSTSTAPPTTIPTVKVPRLVGMDLPGPRRRSPTAGSGQPSDTGPPPAIPRAP